MKNIILFTLGILLASCTTKAQKTNIVTSDIDLFWETYDVVKNEKDSIRQVELLDSLYLKKGSPGLDKIVEARNYKPEEFVNLINNYPKYWESIRSNTYKSKELAKELDEGIEKLRVLYPSLKPAKIYFTIGAMRTNGTTVDSLVLIGSEFAMADKNTDISEIKDERTHNWLKTFFSSNPINSIVLLNIHEYVHTQQEPISNELLYQCLYEGIAEFISVKALDKKSTAPAIEYGKSNPKVMEKFEKEMFSNLTYEWLWSSAPNEFNTRDLGYYIGYEICERYYSQSKDKAKAIKELIEIDYTNFQEANRIIDATKVFSKPVDQLRKEYDSKRPKVTKIKEFENGSTNVNPNIQTLTIEFSESMNTQIRNFRLGPLGDKNLLTITGYKGWSEDGKKVTFEIELKPKLRQQLLVTDVFRSEKGYILQPFLIDITTK